MIIGISVHCVLCGKEKAPHGRSVPTEMESYRCMREFGEGGCLGYDMDPLSGCLWPGETSEDFGYPCCSHATRILVRD